MGQLETVAPTAAPQWALAPSAVRAQEIDRALRGRLAKSFEYIGEVAFLDTGSQAALSNLLQRLSTDPVSPWVYCLYSKLVAELAKNPRADVTGVFQDVVFAASRPANAGVVALREPVFAASWWDHFQLVLDTDRRRPFRPKIPPSEDFSRCQQEIALGLTVLLRGDPVWHDEVQNLLRMIVLGVPASRDSAEIFNGASTFFLWGAVLLNARLRRSAISIVDLLIHESSHVLLFGLSADQALTRNRTDERYASPVREDKRPIDGIFHACFVATRVHLAIDRLLGCGELSAEDTKIAVERQQRNGRVARESLEILTHHAEPTEVGEKILHALQEYWGHRLRRQSKPCEGDTNLGPNPVAGGDLAGVE
jgi:hypothetical protein